MTHKEPPRYRAIANELINDIVAKRYAVGTSLPPETELCERLGVSRHTVREALRILEDGGLISRRQGSGSEVVADTPPVRYRQTVDSIEDLLQYGQQSRLQLLATREEPVDEELARRLGCATSTRCVTLTALRKERGGERGGERGRERGSERGSERGEGGQPFAFTRIWFPPQPARRRDKLLREGSALATMLASIDASTLGHIEQVFTAVALDAEAAAALQVRKGAPSLRSDRAYHDRKGALILLAVSWHRADLFRYATVLRHEGA
jgi:GntR family transcriptional regulator